MLATSHCVFAFNQSTQKNFEFTVRVKFFKWDAQMSVLVYRWIRPSQLINQVCAAIRRNRLQAVTLALRAENGSAVLAGNAANNVIVVMIDTQLDGMMKARILLKRACPYLTVTVAKVRVIGQIKCR